MNSAHQKITPSPTAVWRIRRRVLVYLIVFALLLIAVMPRVDELKAGIKALGTADARWMVVAVLGAVLTYFAAALGYVVLAKVKLRYMRSVAVQVAASFANRLVPSGVGGLGLNVDYLMKQGHKAPEATSVTAVNSAAAFFSYLLLLGSALVVTQTSPRAMLSGASIPSWVAVAAPSALACVIIILWSQKALRQKVFKLAADSWRHVQAYQHSPLRLVSAVIVAALVTVFYVVTLYASAHAIGLSVTIIQAFAAYTIGTLVGAAVPTPGGLGGVEAGLYAGFIAAGYDPSLVVSAIIMYRLITFWLPILPGYVSFWLLERHKNI